MIMLVEAAKDWDSSAGRDRRTPRCNETHACVRIRNVPVLRYALSILAIEKTWNILREERVPGGLAVGKSCSGSRHVPRALGKATVDTALE